MVLDSIEVPAGGPAEDPRLSDIDLRNRLRRITVTVLDAGGDAVRGSYRNAAVMIRGPDDPKAEWYGKALDREDGRVELLVPTPVDLIVFAPGYRTQELYGVFADTTIQLQSDVPVRLRLTSPLPELPEDTTITLFAGRTRPQGYRSPRGTIVSFGTKLLSGINWM